MRWSGPSIGEREAKLGRVLAVALSIVFMVVGAVVVAIPLLLQSARVRRLIEEQIVALVDSETGIDLSLKLDRPTWPPGVRAYDVVIESTTSGHPFAQVKSASVSLRPFALLSGDIALDKIVADGVSLNAELLDGTPQNIPLHLKPRAPSSKARAREPVLHALRIHDIHGHVAVRTTTPTGPSTPIVADVQDLDVDVDVSGESTFVYGVHVSRRKRDESGVGTLVSPRMTLAPPVNPDRFAPKVLEPFVPHEAIDEDAICDLKLDAQILDAPETLSIALERFDLDARMDVDDALGSTPSCLSTRTPPEQFLGLHLSGIDLDLPLGPSPPRPVGAPTDLAPHPRGLRVTARRVTSRISAIGAVAVAARYVALPPMGGWAEVSLSPAMSIDVQDPMPGVLAAVATGKFEAHDLRLEQFRFGDVMRGAVTLKRPLVIGAHDVTIEYGGGKVFADVTVEAGPSAPSLLAAPKKRLPISATIGIKGLPFPGLMRELGVSKASWVRWDFDDAKATIKGFLDPLEIEGELKAQTKGFELATAPVELPNAGHMIGVAKKHGVGRADLDAHIAIDPLGLKFERLHASFGATRVDGRVHLGFDNKLEVDIVSDQLDLSDLSPLAKFTIGGVGKLNYKVRGLFWDPVGDGTFTLDDAVFDMFPLGDIETASAHFRGTTVDLTDLKARYEDSNYLVPNMRVELGRAAGPTVDVLFSSKNFTLADAYQIFHFNDDPRWKEIQGHLAFDGRAHFVVGGAEDVCGGGRLQIDLTGTVLALDLYGERYDGGSISTFVDWVDRDGGALGMDLELRASTLKKKGGGTVVTSGRVARGGRLFLRAVASGIPLTALAAPPPTVVPIDTNIDAVAEIGGTMDAMLIDADVHLSPLRILDESLGPSHVRIRRIPAIPGADSVPPDARGCYARTAVTPFDFARYKADPIEGEFSVTGDLFDRMVRLDDLRITDQRVRLAHTAPGKPIQIVDIDLAPLALMRPAVAEAQLVDHYEAPTTIAINGRMAADITLDSYPVGRAFDSVGKIVVHTLAIEQNDAAIELPRGKDSVITFNDDGISLDETTLGIRFGVERTALVVAAKLDRSARGRDPVTGSPTLSAKLDLPSLPLAKLEDFFPKIERADGTAKARINLSGTLDSPAWDGEIDVIDGTFAMRGTPMPLSAVNGRVIVDPRSGVRIEKLHGEIGGGTIDLFGGAKIDGFHLGDVDIRMKIHDVHARGDGVAATADAVLRIAWSPPEGGSGFGISDPPIRVEGSVDLAAFSYEKQVKLFDVNGFQQAKRSDVDAYDPARDSVVFDVELRAPHGLQIRNNLVEATLGIGEQGLRIEGTNQRFGLLGALHVLPGGKFKLQGRDFEIRTGDMSFRDATKMNPTIDLSAYNDFKRQSTATSAGAEWRLKLHAYGTSDDLKLELTSEPGLAQEDILYLLAVGMTRAEATQLAAGGLLSGGLNILSDVTGVDQTLKQAIPVIDDYRFGTAYNLRTGRTEPQVTLGKRLTDRLRASITSGIGEGSQLIANIDWQLARQLSLQGSYDNVNDVSSASLGNIGLNLRYRIEFGD